MRITIVIRNILALSVLSLLESVHLLIPVVLLVNYVFPLKYDPAVWNKYFPFLQSAIRPEREIFFYHCWLVFALAIHAALMWFFRKDLQDEQLLRRIRGYMINEAVFLFALLFCIFKILAWNFPAWGWVLLYMVLILSWGVRIFWPEARKGITQLWPWVDQLVSSKWCDLLMIGVILMLIFPTDIESILARVFIQERFHHFDGVIMAPGWAWLSGAVLNVDVICQYGLGMTMAVTKLAEMMGGFSYQHVLWVYIDATCIYFIATYVLLRFWLGSFLLAAVGVLLAIKFQMFHWGVAPIIWEFLSVTIVRYFFDVFFLFFILHHLRHRSWGLWAACICSGISLAYMSDTGMYQWVALCVYVLILGWEERKILVGLYAIVPWFLSLVILWMLEGPALWSAAFWQGAMEQGNLFLNGLGALPIYQNLSEGNFFAFFMGLFIPVVYVFSLVLTSAQYALDRRRRENIFVMVLCVYGLGLYHYFICRSAVSSYHAVDIPFVFVLCFWAREILSRVNARLRRRISLLILVMVMMALVTNYCFTYYPNVLNLARYDWSKEKEFYRQQFNFDDDAQLIKGLTSPDEKVPVISSSEVKILMTAHRRPFFYYFPLIYPNFMNTNAFSGTYLYTTGRVQRTLDQLQTAAPRYVFVESIFYRGQLSADIYQKNAGLTILINYLHTYYDVSAESKYLLALKRKGSS